VYFSTGEDGVLGVHELIEEDSQGIGIVADIMGIGISLEIGMVEIWDVSAVSQHLLDALVEGDGLSYLWDAVFNVDVLDVQHAY
jgi:hypothetical protein